MSSVNDHKVGYQALLTPYTNSGSASLREVEWDTPTVECKIMENRGDNLTIQRGEGVNRQWRTADQIQ